VSDAYLLMDRLNLEIPMTRLH